VGREALRPAGGREPHALAGDHARLVGEGVDGGGQFRQAAERQLAGGGERAGKAPSPELLAGAPLEQPQRYAGGLGLRADGAQEHEVGIDPARAVDHRRRRVGRQRTADRQALVGAEGHDALPRQGRRQPGLLRTDGELLELRHRQQGPVAGPRGDRRRGGRRRPEAKPVVSLRHLHPERILPALAGVVFLEVFPEPPDLHPGRDDGRATGPGVAAERLLGDDPLANRLGLAGQGLLGEELEQAGELGGGPENAAVTDPLDVVADQLGRKSLHAAHHLLGTPPRCRAVRSPRGIA